MVRKVMVRKAGGSVSVTIPKDLADRLHLVEGGTAAFVETDAGVVLTSYDPEFDRAMRVYERGAHKYRNALRKLAE